MVRLIEGKTVSIVIVSGVLEELVFPAISVAIALYSKLPSARLLFIVNSQFPPSVAVVSPTTSPFWDSCTVEFGSASPVIMGELSLVILSLLSTPLSLSAGKFKLSGGLTVVSRVKVKLNISDWFPYSSVACNCRVWIPSSKLFPKMVSNWVLSKLKLPSGCREEVTSTKLSSNPAWKETISLLSVIVPFIVGSDVILSVLVVLLAAVSLFKEISMIGLLISISTVTLYWKV